MAISSVTHRRLMYSLWLCMCVWCISRRTGHSGSPMTTLQSEGRPPAMPHPQPGQAGTLAWGCLETALLSTDLTNLLLPGSSSLLPFSWHALRCHIKAALSSTTWRCSSSWQQLFTGQAMVQLVWLASIKTFFKQCQLKAAYSLLQWYMVLRIITHSLSHDWILLHTNIHYELHLVMAPPCRKYINKHVSVHTPYSVCIMWTAHGIVLDQHPLCLLSLFVINICLYISCTHLWYIYICMWYMCVYVYVYVYVYCDICVWYIYVYVYVYVIHVLVYMINHDVYKICKMYISYMYSFWLKQGQTRVFWHHSHFGNGNSNGNGNGNVFPICRPEASWAQTELGLSANDMERLNIQVTTLLLVPPIFFTALYMPAPPLLHCATAPSPLLLPCLHSCPQQYNYQEWVHILSIYIYIYISLGSTCICQMRKFLIRTFHVLNWSGA